MSELSDGKSTILGPGWMQEPSTVCPPHHAARTADCPGLSPSQSPLSPDAQLGSLLADLAYDMLTDPECDFAQSVPVEGEVAGDAASGE